MLDRETDTSLERGRDYAKKHLPNELENILASRYNKYVPNMAESLIEWAYGRHYSREGVDIKTRQLCTIAGLVALGGQTVPQLKANIEHSLHIGVSKREIFEIIWQMSVYTGMPAAINGLNAAIEIFDERRALGF